MMPLQRLKSEDGHVGPTTASVAAIAAGIVASLGIGFDSKSMEIIGVALFSAAIVVGLAAPHLWIRKVWRRLDRITDDSDPDRDVQSRRRIEF
jgi:hypothetical protein